MSPEASAEQPKALGGSTCGRDQRQERRFGLWRSQTKDKVDLSGLKDFVQVHVTLGGRSQSAQDVRFEATYGWTSCTRHTSNAGAPCYASVRTVRSCGLRALHTRHPALIWYEDI